MPGYRTRGCIYSLHFVAWSRRWIDVRRGHLKHEKHLCKGIQYILGSSVSIRLPMLDTTYMCIISYSNAVFASIQMEPHNSDESCSCHMAKSITFWSHIDRTKADVLSVPYLNIDRCLERHVWRNIRPIITRRRRNTLKRIKSSDVGLDEPPLPYVRAPT